MIHVTDLDSLVWFKKIDSMTLDEARGRLLRTAPPNEQMQMGTAFHSILEDPPDEIEYIEKDGYTFRVDCDAEITLPQIRETRSCKLYPVAGYRAILTGKVDGITGNKVTDHKLTFRPNVETYCDSYQWRAYLDIFDADIFEYIIYSARQKDNIITIYDISTMRMFRYPEMHDDLLNGILELVEFVNEHVPGYAIN